MPYTDKEKIRIWAKKDYEKNKEKHKIRVREYRKNNLEKVKSANRRCQLWRCHRLTIDQFDELLKQQNGRCAICGNLPNDSKYLHVDHNHETGKIRGLLCKACNLAIGILKDNPELCISACSYLRRNPVISNEHDEYRKGMCNKWYEKNTE